MTNNNYVQALIFQHLKNFNISTDSVLFESISSYMVISIKDLYSFDKIHQALLAIQLINNVFVDFNAPAFQLQTSTEKIIKNGHAIDVPHEVTFTIPLDQYKLLNSKVADLFNS